jgi:hemin uptake protein HemP
MSDTQRSTGTIRLGKRPVHGTPPRAGDSLPAHPPVAGSLSSNDLLNGRNQVDIVHNGETYRLRATRLGKLILTK